MPSLQVITEVPVQANDTVAGKKQTNSEATDFMSILAALVTTPQSVAMTPISDSNPDEASEIVDLGVAEQISQLAGQGGAVSLGEECLPNQLQQEETTSIIDEKLLENNSECLPTESIETPKEMLSTNHQQLGSAANMAERLSPAKDEITEPIVGNQLPKFLEDEKKVNFEKNPTEQQILSQTIPIDASRQLNKQEGNRKLDLEIVDASDLPDAKSTPEVTGRIGRPEEAFAESDHTETGLSNELELEVDSANNKDSKEEVKAFADFLPKLSIQAEEESFSSLKGFQIPQQEVAEELPKIIQHQIRDTEGQEVKREIMIQLEPKELGKLLVKLTEQDGVISVKIIAEQVEAKQLAESGLFNLRQSLAEQGIKYGQLDVESSSQYLQYQQQHQHHQHQQQQQQQQQPQIPSLWNRVFSEETWSDGRYHLEVNHHGPQGVYRSSGGIRVDYIV